MTYVITEACRPRSEQGCMEVCPVFCIYDVEDTLLPKSAQATKVIINPLECIDCGLCREVCQQQAIYAEEVLPDKWRRYARMAYDAFAGPPWRM